MIESVEEFVALRRGDESEQQRASLEPAPISVWLDVIRLYPEMKSWVVHNKTVPVEILEILGRDPDKNVRFVVAAKRKCPLHLLEALATDESPEVRLRVAYNAKTPREILVRMLQDPWERVVEVASSRLGKNHP